MERIERYWKIEEQRIVTAALALDAATLPEAVVEGLRLASNVAGGWEVNCPQQAGDGSLHFDGWTSTNFRVAGVASAAWSFS